MEMIYVAHGGKEVVVGGKVTILDSATINGGIIDYVPDSKATNVAALRADFNAFLAAIRDAGLMRPEPVKAEPEEAPIETGDEE